MTVVVGYIPSAVGEAALDAAIEEARRRGEAIHVINVGESDAVRDPRYVDDRGERDLRVRLEAAGLEHTFQALVRGKEAAEEIVEAAELLDASVIVIGLRRRSATGKLLFGSQAQRILLDAECPVLGVKAPR